MYTISLICNFECGNCETHSIQTGQDMKKAYKFLRLNFVMNVEQKKQAQ